MTLSRQPYRYSLDEPTGPCAMKPVPSTTPGEPVMSQSKYALLFNHMTVVGLGQVPGSSHLQDVFDIITDAANAVSPDRLSVAIWASFP